MIAENIHHIRQRVAAACQRAGRSAGEVTLIAVAKTFSSSAVAEALSAGVPDIGENYVQEFLEKRSVLANEAVRWHFIGHLQRNKVKSVVDAVAMIHSVDSLRLGREISERASEKGRVVDILLEVNTSGEASKFGVAPSGAAELAAGLAGLACVRLVGLMTIGPFLPDPEESRGAFRGLAGVRAGLVRSGFTLPHLSMGMTNDFEVAIEEGSTMIRIGTAIFGRRTKPGAAA
jgi:pyridoxal phosphate enzyme (YggS family)